MNDILHQPAPAEGLVSIITPAFNETESLPVLYERLTFVMTKNDLTWNWIVVDDHPADDTVDIGNRSNHCVFQFYRSDFRDLQRIDRNTDYWVDTDNDLSIST